VQAKATVGRDPQSTVGRDPRCPRPAMPVRLAKRLAQETLDDFETIGRADPFLNVPDDPDHSDGGLIACKRTVPGHLDGKTAVTFSEDAYRYEIENGVPYVVYASDRVVWTMRFG